MTEDYEIRLVLLCRQVRRAQRKMHLFPSNKNMDRCADLEEKLDAFLAQYDCDRDLRDLVPPRRMKTDHE